MGTRRTEPKKAITSDGQSCEEFYQQNHHRDAEGKFTVKVPFKEGKLGPERLGVSKNQCVARFLQLERRFVRDEG